ncbi:hypothetical protein K470DRAFT_203962, partial [Piedraia hortae CBS 480.64]
VYLVSVSIIGSVIMFAAKNIDYVDALFLATGAATQSGLNTVDLNTLFLYQQIVLIMISHITTPIFINTAVVFVRLYWFEKRFEHIVKEARNQRRTRTLQRNQTRESSPSRVEMGVAGRPITVLHHTTVPNGMTTPKGPKQESPADEDAASQSPTEGVQTIGPGSDNDGLSGGLPSPRLNREITFADELPPSASGNLHSPPLERVSEIPEPDVQDRHIQIFRRQQQNASTHRGTLRIPGPRDFDQGAMVKEVDDEPELEPTQTLNTGVEQSRFGDLSNHAAGSELAHRRAITIDEPDPPKRSDYDEKKPAPVGTRANMLTSNNGDHMPYLSWQATTGRNSAFFGLNQEQREELGGIEYRALKTLAMTLICYYIGFHLFGLIVYLGWIQSSGKGRYRQVIRSGGVKPVWWGIFQPASMFNDVGFSMTPDSMMSFQTAVVPLLFGAFLIVIGNTGFPCMLRFIIWLASFCAPTGSGLWEEFRFLLDHPRRCFTLMFPSRPTWWLAIVLIILNGSDLIFFIILDLHNKTVDSVAPGYRVLDGLFQAAATRTAGFSVVDVADVHPAMQVSYLVMMYISVFPIAISVRNTNVYEEKSLGIWNGGEEATESDDVPSYIAQHLRRQLSFDLWFVFLGFFLVCIVEGKRLADMNDSSFTMFAVLFEIVSAYGTVGMSLGYPNTNTAFSAQLHSLSKVMLMAIMIRGRHRGLPYALDRAILLPSENLHKADEILARTFTTGNSLRPQRTNSTHRENDQDPLGQSTAIDHHPDAGEATHHGLRNVRRKTSGLSDAASGRRSHRRSMSLGAIIAGGLGAGPTISK